ncbi:fibronectin type III domain-containing protein [Nocardioides sp.]|uniref:fibronectin type III domain-containing protein n=1 Tax=Nocardioides sp. TaxID=35761 RepID=UPI00378416C2
MPGRRQVHRLVLPAVVGLALLTPAAAQAADPPADPPAGPPARAHRDIAPLPAVSADSVVDAYGVGIHLNFLDTPYRDAGAVADALVDLGVRHVRDDLYLDAPRQYRAIRTVARRGIGFDLIMGRPGTGATPEDYVDTVADRLPAGAVEGLEGVNEWDLFGGSGWVRELRGWQRDLYDAAKSDPATAHLPVLSPALAFRWNYADVGDLSPWADVANAHMYPGGYEPSNEIDRITQAVRAVLPGPPLVTTEAGYNNAVNTSNGHLPVPEDVAAAYLPRLLLEHLVRGERRVYTYELIDSFEDPTDTDVEAHFGLLRHDLSPKPAYTAMKDLLALLADPGPAFVPGSLDVAADGLPADARYLLTQRRDGRFVLLLWRDVRLYDPREQTPLPVTPADVTLRLDTRQDLTVYRPTDGAAPVAETVGTSLPLRLDGQVTAITIDPPLPPAPTAPTARPRDGAVVLSWRLPTTSATVSGFEVARTDTGERWTLPADARRFRAGGLENGRSYGWTVRAVGPNGSSDPVAVSVVPGAAPAPPGRPSVVAGPGELTVRWAPADGRGRPVTAYRLRVHGRVVTVAADARRATVAGLPAGLRVRATVQARNTLGWGRPARTGWVRIP